MLGRSHLTAIVPKKYREQAGILTVTSLEELEHAIKRLNEQTSAAWFITALALYAIVYDGELYSASNLTWRQYRAQTRERYGMDYQDFSEALSAGKFIAEYGKQLFAAGWAPDRSMRKLARANLALKVCGDPNLVIQHLVNDQWIEFKAWYASLKHKLIETPENKRGRPAKRVIEIKRGKIYIDGVEPVKFDKSISNEEKKALIQIIINFYTNE